MWWTPETMIILCAWQNPPQKLTPRKHFFLKLPSPNHPETFLRSDSLWFFTQSEFGTKSASQLKCHSESCTGNVLSFFWKSSANMILFYKLPPSQKLTPPEIIFFEWPPPNVFFSENYIHPTKKMTVLSAACVLSLFPPVKTGQVLKPFGKVEKLIGRALTS